MDFVEGLGAQWWWLLAAAILGILEIFVPGIFLVWMAIAAGITGVLVMLMPTLPLGFQLGIFALLAFSAVYSGRRFYERNPVGSEDPNLNERTARLIGKTVTVETAIQHGRGRVRIGDSLWIAQGPDAAAGSQVTVVSADGSCLTVAPAGEA